MYLLVQINTEMAYVQKTAAQQQAQNVTTYNSSKRIIQVLRNMTIDKTH